MSDSAKNNILYILCFYYFVNLTKNFNIRILLHLLHLLHLHLLLYLLTNQIPLIRNASNSIIPTTMFTTRQQLSAHHGKLEALYDGRNSG